MARYLVLFNAPQTASEFMAQSSPEQMKAGMDAWLKWRDELAQTLKFEFGMPVQIRDRVTADNITEGGTQVSGYAIMEGDSKTAVVEALRLHPHLQRPGASIDVLEMLHMPGVEA